MISPVFSKNLFITPEIQQKLKSNQPIVALESTIISHGMPYPQNYETALQVESDIRKAGATPATIAVIDGIIRIGLSEPEIENFAKNSKGVLKLSRRDLGFVLSQKKTGSTTVAATMILAKLAGISIFATGGIGGVHREGQDTLDISADLRELSQTQVAVVCAGAKSILDIGRTLEVLETFGVPVLGYGTDRFPAFYSRESSFPVDYRIDTPAGIASFIKFHWAIPHSGGALIVNPIPRTDEIPAAVMENEIQKALAEAKEKQITGKAVTPFLLSKIVEQTQGQSLKSNISLIRSNARLAAEIAVKSAQGTASVRHKDER